MYTVLEYGRMALDGVRMDAYRRAILGATRPGSIVVDLGAGTGILSLLAARAGAHVHAVEPSTAILLLPILARENGLADKITVHNKSSLELELAERADVVVGDLRGNSPLLEPNIEVFRDAKRRLLKPGGTLIPQRDRLFVSVVESDKMEQRLTAGHAAFERLGFRASAATDAVLHAVYSDSSEPIRGNDVLSTSECWSTVEYGADAANVYEGTVSLTARRHGRAIGLSIWFEATLAAGIQYVTAPGNELAYGRTFLPFRRPFATVPGDTFAITLRADAHGKRWAWDTAVSGSVSQQMRQATFLGNPADPASLLKASGAHVPQRSKKGENVRRVLDAMDGTKSTAELATSVGVSLDEVRDLVERYAR